MGESSFCDKNIDVGDDIGQSEAVMSELPGRRKAVVTVRNAMKRYGSSDLILDNFNMTIQQGTIYSLLGSSGCGKTTLLSCLVGIKHLNSGQIIVFGAEPGTKESGIPGKRVGYMPQDSALYNDFTISEAMRYFGTIYGMSTLDINTSRDFLMTFLDLPIQSRKIGTLSGGQMRRVSLALSLIHSPELLILDEPTVGVDPLLRESIWNHLCKLVSSQNTTVIITTHYIEEARQSNTIGLMRGGRLLAERSPDALLKEFNCNLLEDIVLKLCKKDAFGSDQSDFSISYKEAQGLGDDILESNKPPYAMCRKFSKFGRRESIAVIEASTTVQSSINRIKALVIKNIVMMLRNFVLVIFLILIPPAQIIIVCIAIGNDPKSIPLGFVNHEQNYSTACLNPMLSYGGCDVENLGCKFLSKLPSETVDLNEYESEDAARDAVRKGDIYGFVSFPEHFSKHLYSRSSNGNSVDNETLDGSKMLMELDMSSKQIALTLKRVFYDVYNVFLDGLLTDCGLNPKLAESPFKYESPIFGNDKTKFIEFVAPGMLIGVLMFYPICSSSIIYIKEKKQGTLERGLVAGVQTWEIMVAFFITEGCVLVIQAGLALTVVLGVFKIVIQGSLLLAISLSIMMGLLGVSLGFLIGSFCNEEVEAVLFAISTFVPNFLIAGIMWPLQGAWLSVQYFSYLLPCTLASEAIRSIVTRGLGLESDKVWPGFVALLGWIALYWALTIFIHRKGTRK